MAKESTIKVKLNQGMAGHVTDAETGKARHSFVRNPGDVVNMLEVEAKRYIERGYATAVTVK